jgi:uncharacterized protein (UPF0332 family)
MIYQWSEFFELAQGLYDDPDTPGPQEAAYRSSASRAYYAAFHHARVFAREDGFSRSEPSHHDIIGHFADSGNLDRRKIGNQLRSAFTYRKWADYYDTFPRPWSPGYLAEKTIVLATQIIEQLHTLQSS